MVAQMAAADAAGKLAQNKWTPIVLGIVIVGGATLSFFAMRAVLCKLEVIECATDRRAKRALNKLMKLDAFNPNFYQSSMLTITHNNAKIRADELNSAFGVFNDDEEGVYSVLRQVGTENNMSLVSKYFEQRHNSSLVDQLAYYLDDEDEAKRMLLIAKDLK
jgi:hypothetical protein